MIDTTSPTHWGDLSCITGDNSNARGGLFKVSWAIYGEFYLTDLALFLRPKGSDWGHSYDDLSPSVRGGLETNGTTNYIKNKYIGGLIMCPFGTDNKVQYYASAFSGSGDTPPDPTYSLKIHQIGVYI